ncbi:MAG: radical SAM-associated putative lipoprotein [Bacteroidetes bacterium]|nr:radical SAM-associated putative lipoprotein [Bacteroidota bacterium]MCL2301677.1 radical SAM-associated putative lipoprotein [Lentimicrobiaceae bacterium]
MKKPIIKFLDKVILLLLGFSGILYSCAKYGMPVDEFEIKGMVTDATYKPIQNIRVIRQKQDTLYTNSEGKYSFKFWGPNFVHLKIEDIDGDENGGEFATREIDVRFTDADLVKKGKKNKTADKYVKTLNIILWGTDDEPPVIVEYGPPSASFKP